MPALHFELFGVLILQKTIKIGRAGMKFECGNAFKAAPDIQKAFSNVIYN